MELKSYEIKHILKLIEWDERIGKVCKCDKVYWQRSDNIKQKLNNILNEL